MSLLISDILSLKCMKYHIFSILQYLLLFIPISHILNKTFQEKQYMSQLHSIPSYLKHLECGKMCILELRKI